MLTRIVSLGKKTLYLEQNTQSGTAKIRLGKEGKPRDFMEVFAGYDKGMRRKIRKFLRTNKHMDLLNRTLKRQSDGCCGCGGPLNSSGGCGVCMAAE